LGVEEGADGGVAPGYTRRPMAKKRSGYDTGLAAEFYVLSCLHRLGISATLTLGNKKGIDLVVVRDGGDAATIEVKGVAGKHDWFAPNLGDRPRKGHFVVLISYEGKIADTSVSPSVWVLPHNVALAMVKQFSSTRGISRKSVRERCAEYRFAWARLLRD
jgi:hypothetical protein